MPNRWKGWPRLLPVIKSKKRILILLDFDGTLAPIVPVPQQAHLPDETREILRRLQNNPRVTVAIISGRSLIDLKHKAFLYGAYYSGNHGLEISGPKIDYEYPGIRHHAKNIAHLARHFHEQFQIIPGALVQNKGFSLSIHYRNVRPHHMDAFADLIKQSIIETATLPVVWRRGRKVHEVLPAVDWNKGRAALWLMKKLHDPYPLAFGDDKTDDSMFRALHRKGITTRIGRKRKLAHFSVKNPHRVYLFLRLLEQCLTIYR